MNPALDTVLISLAIVSVGLALFNAAVILLISRIHAAIAGLDHARRARLALSSKRTVFLTRLVLALSPFYLPLLGYLLWRLHGTPVLVLAVLTLFLVNMVGYLSIHSGVLKALASDGELRAREPHASE